MGGRQGSKRSSVRQAQPWVAAAPVRTPPAHTAPPHAFPPLHPTSLHPNPAPPLEQASSTRASSPSMACPPRSPTPRPSPAGGGTPTTSPRVRPLPGPAWARLVLPGLAQRACGCACGLRTLLTSIRRVERAAGARAGGRGGPALPPPRLACVHHMQATFSRAGPSLSVLYFPCCLPMAPMQSTWPT